MALNVDRYRDAIVGAWKQVMDEKDPTNWALFGYHGQSYDLNLVSKGDGGLEELAEDLNSGQIMYALCRVKLKEKNVEKVILVNWQGEGAPLARKGTCANHIGTVKNFFKGVNVTINARTEEDVDADVILQTVAKAVAGEGLAQTSSISEAPAPVGTVYKKVNPKDDINSAAKDEFWKKEEQEEERRKRDEQNRYRKFSQNEVKLLRRESQEYFNEAEKEPVFKTNGTNGNSSYMSTAEAVKASMPKRDSTSGDLVRQRIKSFDHGASPSSNGGQSPSNGVGDNKNNGTVSESVSVLKRRQMFEGGSMNSTTSAPVHRRNPAQEIKEAQDSAKKTISSEIQQPPVTKTPTPKTQPAMESRPAEIKSYTPAIVPDTVKSISPTPIPTVVETKPVHHYDEPARDEPLNGNYEHEDVNGGAHVQESGKFPDLVAEADRHEMTSPVVEINSEMGTCARALYDYQAADDSEITFDPGEIITNIEKIDEGWWEGMGPRGVYGLFPANYVELLN